MASRPTGAERARPKACTGDEALLARANELASELGELLRTKPHLGGAIVAAVLEHVLIRFRSRLIADAQGFEIPAAPPSANRPRRKEPRPR